MDLSTLALAATQVANGQRAQQGGISALKQQQLQAETFASLIAETASSARASGGGRIPTPVSATGDGSPSSDQKTPQRGLPRGSLVNILA